MGRVCLYRGRKRLLHVELAGRAPDGDGERGHSFGDLAQQLELDPVGVLLVRARIGARRACREPGKAVLCELPAMLKQLVAQRRDNKIVELWRLLERNCRVFATAHSVLENRQALEARIISQFLQVFGREVHA